MNETPAAKPANKREGLDSKRPSAWIEFGCYLLCFFELFLTCFGLSTMTYSAKFFYHGHWTAFHIVSCVIILIGGSAICVIILQLPYLITVERCYNSKQVTSAESAPSVSSKKAAGAATGETKA